MVSGIPELQYSNETHRGDFFNQLLRENSGKEILNCTLSGNGFPPIEWEGMGRMGRGRFISNGGGAVIQTNFPFKTTKTLDKILL